MTKPIGVKDWVIAEGYIPRESHGPEPQMMSHETVCLLNCSDKMRTWKSPFITRTVSRLVRIA